MQYSRVTFWAFLLFLCIGAGACQQRVQVNMDKPIDWQGHRGARGLAPENTLPAFAEALRHGVTTLELDLAVSADSQLIVSHEPWFAHDISTAPDGQPISEAEEKHHLIYALPYAQIMRYDVGLRQHPKFAQQRTQPAHKPTLAQVVQLADSICKAGGLPPIQYNIEIKSQPEWDGRYTPPVAVFAQLVLAEVQHLGIAQRVCIQSFDTRALQACRRLAPTQTLALLIENINSPQANLDALGFVPQVYSPYYKLVNPGLAQLCARKKMRLIPWTVNEEADMQALLRQGVDGLISDYPDRMASVRAWWQAQKKPTK